MTDTSPIRVPPDFEREFPGASRSASESAANLVRTADAFLLELDRRRRKTADLSASAFETLAILEGAGEPLAGHVIAERLLVSSASMTSILDTLERHGLVGRSAHPTDRRKVLIHLADGAQDIVDRMLPVVHLAAAEAFADLSESDREVLILLLARIRTRLALLSSATPREPAPRRRSRRVPPKRNPGSR
ncbi:MAG: MarR family winged helix-turn-helix transcriptional regulator [Acidimicrobiales bacterium]